MVVYSRIDLVSLSKLCTLLAELVAAHYSAARAIVFDANRDNFAVLFFAHGATRCHRLDDASAQLAHIILHRGVVDAVFLESHPHERSLEHVFASSGSYDGTDISTTDVAAQHTADGLCNRSAIVLWHVTSHNARDGAKVELVLWNGAVHI